MGILRGTLGLFVILFSLAFSRPAEAIIFAPAFNYTSGWVDSSETSSLMIDLRLGTLIGTSFYIGGIYHIEREDTGASDTNVWAAGPSAGIYLGNFSLIGSYHVVSERKSGATEFTGGAGPQIDIAYAFELGSSVKLGPQFTWREIQYDSPTTRKFGSLRPYVALFFEF